MLTFSQDMEQPGHLRYVDGGWRIFIPKLEFKNFRGAAKERDYDMPVRPEVWGDIERYLKVYRPVLAASSNPYVFASSVKSDKPMHSLRRRFGILTMKYLAGCRGVGPHAMRHLVATAILKQRPNDWNTAARALHDREATVRKHYAHLSSDDAATQMKVALDGPFSRM
jgi:integrase